MPRSCNSPTHRSPIGWRVAGSTTRSSSPGIAKPSRASSRAPSVPGDTGRATWSCSSIAASTTSVRNPAPGRGNVPAIQTSAMPNAGKADPGSRSNCAAASRNARNPSASIGSAPFRQMRSRDRSSPSARRSDRVANANAKFGPAVMVPSRSDTQRIQRVGFDRKSWGAPCTRPQPVDIGIVSSPMSPMS